MTKTVFDAKTREAQCFFASAELKAEATVVLEEGENEVLLSGISPFLMENSVRVRIAGEAVLSSYEYVRNLSLAEEKDRDALKEELSALRRELDALKALDVIGEETARILTEALPGRLSSGENPTEEELSKSIAYYQEKQTQLLTERQQREKEKSLLERKIREKDEELKHGGVFGNYLKLRVNAKAAGEYPLEITYSTAGVGWTPFYTITVKDEKEPVEIVLKARLCQTTGVDWQDVRLSFSTGMPNAGGQAPELVPWTLYEYPSVAAGGRAKNAVSFAGRAMMKASSEAVMVEEEADLAPMAAGLMDNAALMANHLTVQEDALSVTYAIDLCYSVSGAGKEQNVDLKTFQAPARFYYLAVPKLSEDVFYMAELLESEKLDLPAGTASVHYNGTYLGETEIDGAVTLEKLTLTLGKDRRISVKREQEMDYKEKKFFGVQTEQEFAYVITAKNNKTEDVTLKIKDQYPKSSDKEIAVRLSDKITSPKENDEKKGFLTWETVLPAGKAEKIEFSYSVTYPKDKRLNL